MTERLYYDDPYLTAFSADVVAMENDGRRVYLDRTAFYPTSGGQPHDTGTIADIPVIDVEDEGKRIAHVLAGPLAITHVHCAVDWDRREDHMQQHTGQHLLSAVLEDLYRIPTVSFHLGAEASTIDIETGELSAAQLVEVEGRSNERIREGRAVRVSYEEVAQAAGLRKASERGGTLRIIEIEGLDRSACGGTHLRSTAGIGLLLLRRQERVRGNVRLEFLCGRRALAQTRQDFETLGAVAKLLGASPADVPGLVEMLQQRVQSAERERRKLSLELAAIEGRRLYSETAADPAGVRRHLRRLKTGAIDDELRIVAQSFTSGAKAVFAAAIEDSRLLLLAASKDSGVDSGQVLKRILNATGGRGGGSPAMAQGNLPSQTALERAVAELGFDAC